MSIEALKHGFISYLKELNEKTSKEYAVNDADVSIFMYSSEFKSYIEDELNVTTNLVSMSVSDILEMDIKNGKLVEKEEVGADTFTKTTEDNTQTENENTENNPFASASDPNSLISDVTGTQEEQTDAAIGEAKEALTGDQSVITNILNSLFQDKTVIDTLDTSKNGKLDEEEIEAFLEAIKEMDGNKDDISLEDILQSIDSIKDKSLDLKGTEEAEDEEKVKEAEEAGGTTSSNASNGTSSSSGGGGSSSFNNSNTNTDNKTKDQKDVSSMTMDELNTELKSTEDTIKEGQDTLTSVLDGTEEGMKGLQEAMDAAYDTYQKELEVLDKDMAKELDELKKSAEEQEEKVDNKEKEITTQEGVVSDAEGAYNDAVSTRESLEGTLSSLESALSSAKDEEKGSIESQIASVKSQLEAAKAAEETAKQTLEEAKEKLTTLKDEKVTLDEELTKREQKVTEYEQEIAEKHPEVAEYQKAYDDAKAERDNYKKEATAALKKDISSLQSYKNEINSEITDRKNKETEKENGISADSEYDAEKGEELIGFAKKMLSKYGSSTGYCAAGVSRTFSMAYGISLGGNGNDWDTNMEKLVEQGMFKEVTDSYATSDELSNLPAGAVVCWEATGGTNGGGAQYGHVAIADGNGGEISDHYQKNIYKSVGGRDDQYRVFIPV